MNARKGAAGLRGLAQLGLLDRSVIEEGGNRRGIWEIIREQRKLAPRNFTISCFASMDFTKTTFQRVFFRAENCLCDKKNGHNPACEVYEGIATDTSGIRSVLELTAEAAHQALAQAGKKVPAFELREDWAEGRGAYIVGDQAHSFPNVKQVEAIPHVAHIVWNLHYPEAH